MTTSFGNDTLDIRLFPTVWHECKTMSKRLNLPLTTSRCNLCCRSFVESIAAILGRNWSPSFSQFSALVAALHLEAFEAMVMNEIQNSIYDDLMKWATKVSEEENYLYGACRKDHVQLLGSGCKKLMISLYSWKRMVERRSGLRVMMNSTGASWVISLGPWHLVPTRLFTKHGHLFSSSQNSRGTFEYVTSCSCNSTTISRIPRPNMMSSVEVRIVRV